jgi:cobalamin biosynthesis Mg chelatase CobN
MLRDYRSVWRAVIWLGLFCLALSCAVTSMAAVEVIVNDAEAAPGEEVEVPISVSGAAGLEALQFVMRFDPQALKLMDIVAGPLAGAADVNLKERQPGAVRVAMLPERALDRGDGTLLRAHFQILGESEQEMQVSLEEVKASEFRDQFPVWMKVTARSGVVRTSDAVQATPTPGLAPLPWIAAAIVVVLILVMVFLFRRKKNV